jgi:hypothetical protein
MADSAGLGGDLGSLTVAMTSAGFNIRVETDAILPGSEGAPRTANSRTASKAALEWLTTLACGDVSKPDATIDLTNCTLAMSVCGRTSVLFYLWARASGGLSAWRFQGQRCSDQALPPGIPRLAVPTLDQIQTAFRRLPFARPSVSVQPAGNVTLVNLPTFYQAVWPSGAALKPGDISHPVQLLSWSLEFAISAVSYDFHFGDGTSSGAVTDPGGGYPDGSVRHSYGQPAPGVAVGVDARLTARYRVNGGAWTELDAVADLTDAPVTTLQVREATARLVAN